MNKWFLSVVFLCITKVTVAAEFEAVPMIVNGHTASISNYPYMASLYYDRRTDYGYYGNYCGASILDSWHVMTAAHCVQDADYNDHTTVVLQLQNERDFWSAQKIPAESFYFRDDYRGGATYLWANDIAIIKLASEIQNIPSSNYVRLPKSGDDSNYRVSNAVFTAIGHGNTASNVDSSLDLLQTQVNYLSASACSTFGAINNSHLCTQGDYSSLTGLRNGICQGDSGGPLLWFDGNVFRQVGIASFGPGTCGHAGSLSQGVFTEVLDYTGWIQSVVSGAVAAKHTVNGVSNLEFGTSQATEESAGSLGVVSVLVAFGAFIRRRHREKEALNY
ncbi:S1 family peptidase [Vibrio tapetis]|uniref:Putative trypsin-like serine protease n=1 Tax=Vibrio tapetis subsp. tapetis TaxID=1671868 RepID=A0A2N8ZML8_9VIBR|nr:serine protease [Vibrio tapetis]SON53171.1 putative trypsin-like serine protease [Vibrio tapetis subsp. tapetis]